MKIDDETRLLNLAEVSEATWLAEETLANLVYSSLFPSPVHMNPPLWSAQDVEAWVIVAAQATAGEVNKEKIVAA